MDAKRFFRAAAYCRVSTLDEEQLSSLSSQKIYFENYIKSQGWTLCGIYSDEGVTGTSAEKRQGFLKMMSDAHAGAFDIIVTKEISRFARNTLDSIYYTRKLSQIGVGVYFINDNINTLDSDAELRLTIMSSIAQEESRRTSQRVKWGQKRRMEEGVVFGRSLLGYDVKEGKLYVNEEGASLVERIFSMYTRDLIGAHTIARILTLEGIPTFHGAEAWSGAVIRKILKNEKYIGVLRQKKTVTKDYLTHRRIKNDGSEDEIIIENHHEAIISREVFDLAKNIMERRKASTDTRHSARYCFSGKLICPICNGRLVSRSKTRKDGSIYRAWKCCGPQISHAVILRAVSESFSSLSEEDREKLKKAYSELRKENVSLMESKSPDNEKQLSKKRFRAAKLYAEGIITDAEFRALEREFTSANRLIKAYSPSFFKEKDGEEELYKHIVQRITVHGKNLMEIEFIMNVCATWTAQE